MDGRTSVTQAKGVRVWLYWAVLLPLVVALAILAAAHLRKDTSLREEIIRLRADSSRAEANEQELQRLQERVRSHDADAERLRALTAELEQVRGRLKETDAARAAASDAASNRVSAIQTENTLLNAQLNDVTSRFEASNRRLNGLKAENGQLKADFTGKPRVPRVGAWIGANIGEVGENNPAAQTGVVILQVVERSPAAAAGLKAGDIVSSVNGQPISGTQEFKNALAQLAGGQVFPVVVERKGGPVTLQVWGGDWPQ